MSQETLEKRRVELQGTLDDSRSQLERNKLGQFATPGTLARDIVGYAAKMLSGVKIRFLDPAFGTGSFYSALLAEFGETVEKATGYEIDQSYAEIARELWTGTRLNLVIGDFTEANPVKEDRVNLVVCNPPYVRHHHLSSKQKTRLGHEVEKETGIRLNGLSGFYCYYVLLTGKWMKDDALACWLVPSEFMDVNYGFGLKKYLTEKVTLVKIHRFDPQEVQFNDAYVSSVVLFFKNTPPRDENVIEATYGGTLSNPNKARLVSLRELRTATKWTSLLENHNNMHSNRTTLGTLFRIKRGLATGSNEFFILNEEQVRVNGIPKRFLTPILPMPRQLKEDEIKADSEGNPTNVPKLFLVSCDLDEKEVELAYPSLWNYLQRGVRQKINETYLCKHRSPWYSQEKRPAPPYLCSYIGRSTKQRDAPFRFILNNSNATASNSYLLLYPKPGLENALITRRRLREMVWRELQAIPSSELIYAGRVYGGGLHKLEPKELANLPITNLLANLSDQFSDDEKTEL